VSLQNAHGALAYAFGGSAMFRGHDCYPPRWGKIEGATDTEAAHAAAYNYAKDFLREAFDYAKTKGIKTAIGSEVPAMPPKSLNTTLDYLGFYTSPRDQFTTTGKYPCEYSMTCDWMCDPVVGRGPAKAPRCSAAFTYALPYGHHTIQSWTHPQRVPHAVALFTFYNGTTTTDGNTLLSTEPLPARYAHSSYKSVRSEGFIFPPNLTQAMLPPGALMSEMRPLKLWRKAGAAGDGDVFASSSELLDARARASNFTELVTVLGYVYGRRPAIWLQQLYEGVLTRLDKGMGADLVWLWTQEIWNPRAQTGVGYGLNSSGVTSVVEDFLALDAARKALNAEDRVELGTAGWTLGPMADRAYWDKVLPKDWLLSSIDEALGQTDVEPEYAEVKNHRKQIIPWAEDVRIFLPHLRLVNQPSALCGTTQCCAEFSAKRGAF
jgi:hypothetical protein